MPFRFWVGCVAMALVACGETAAPPIVSVSVQGVSDFGAVQMGRSRTRPLVLRNNSDVEVELVAVKALSGDGFDVFSVEVIEGPLCKGCSLVLQGTFHPPSAQVGSPLSIEYAGRFAFILRRADGTEDETAFTLAGRGVNQCNTPPRVDFGAAVVGSSVTRRIIIPNDTDEAAVATIGALQSDVFTVNLQGEQVIQPRATLELELTYSPLKALINGAALPVSPGSHCPSVDVAVMGLGVEQLVTCDLVEFGAVNPASKATAPLTIRNSAGMPVALNRLATAPPFALTGSDFVVVPAATREASGRWAPGEVTLDVTFSSPALGPYAGEVTASLQLAGQSRLSCGLDAWGGGADIQISPGSVELGVINFYRDTPVVAGGRGTLHIHNPGDAPLDVTAITATPVSADASDADLCVGDYSDASQRCLGLPPRMMVLPGSSLEVPVRVAPSRGGQTLEWRALVSSSDLDEPSVAVPIRATSALATPCRLAASSTQLDFGDVLAPGVRDLQLTLTNLSTNPSDVCELGAPRLVGAPEITVIDGLGARLLQPGQSVTLTVRAGSDAYWTNGRPFNGLLRIDVSDPLRPVLELPVFGTLITSCLVTRPGVLDLPPQPLTCAPPTATLTLINVCAQPVPVTASVMGAGYQLASPTSFSVPVRATSTVTVQRTSTAPFDQASLQLVSSEPSTSALTQQVLLRGRTTGATHTEQRVIATRRQLDVLLVVDDSCSMMQHAATLTSQLTQLYDAFAASGQDVQVAVMRTVDSDWEERDQPLQVWKVGSADARAQVLARAAGTFAASGEVLAHQVVQGTAPFRLARLLRPDASLMVVLVTDVQEMPDVSPYVAPLRALKGERFASRFSYSTVVPLTTTCAAGYGPLNPSHTELSSLLGGISQDLCSAQWATALSTHATQFLGPERELYLEGTPSAGIDLLKVNGTTVPAGPPIWEYDAARRAVVFGQLYAPGPATSLELQYTPACQ